MKGGGGCHPPLHVRGSLLLRRFVFPFGRGERETRVTGDEPQGTMGRVQTAGEACRPLSPSRLPLRAHFHQKRDVWLGGSVRGLTQKY